MHDHDQLLVASWKDITLERFQHYWRNGKPAMIQDTMERSQIAWTPDFFCAKYGKQRIDAIDCHTTKVTKMTINDFFKQYMETNYQSRVLKIKDWPPGADFQTKCPLMYKDFMAMLPVPEYCAATGVYNLSNRLPDQYIKPDLGPKMFIAYGLDPTDTACQVGTTNLHCDMTDAVNVMCHAQKTQYYDMNDNNKTYDIGVSSSPGKAAAVWDIFSFSDLPYLRLFVGELLKEKEEQSTSMSKKISKLDPIHGQWIYLTEQHLQRLKTKYNVEPWRLYQNPGDAIYIPAGCAHQVANYCNAIKCAYDFVSPENINRSSTITQQFGRAKQEDVLQLKTTLLYTWLSVYKASQDLYPSPPADDDSSCLSPYHTDGTNQVAGKKRKHGKHENDGTSKKCKGSGNHECSPTDDL
ncbi:hypothetical protein BCR42DRAFT_325368 [Absidia repens]|uniref:JmjC domain-containing protein n=1 Tax=Absidia repens TaxID=90262 RepID=A0A1X2IKG2_9FUNG|nr:hypothetical protein BCR42DRAFT_325368 [Absidia repens]